MRYGFSAATTRSFDDRAYHWSLPSGHTCFGAEKCLASADRYTGKITNGAHQEYRCYSAVMERFSGVRAKYWANFEAVKNMPTDVVSAILKGALPRDATVVRAHVAGDFFSQAYFDGWLQLARARPSVRFYAFTKSLPLWVKRQNEVPSNLVLTASYGGKYDAMITAHRLKSARVVNSEAEAAALGLRIDYDDSLAADGGESFALLLIPHGKQRLVPLTIALADTPSDTAAL